MRQRASIPWLLLPLMWGCSFVIEPDKTQCDTRSDCNQAFGESAKLLCIDHLCERPRCDGDDTCRSFGAGYENTVCVERACVAPASGDAGMGPPDPAWACLDDDATGAPILPGPFRVKLPVTHMVSQEPLIGVSARLCQKVDLTCSNALRTEVTNAAGELSLSVDGNFTGYVSLTRSDLMPTSYFFNPRIQADTVLPMVQLAQPETTAGLALIVGTQSAERGLVLLAAYNCLGAEAAGVTFSSKDADGTTVTFYSSGGLPSKTAVETDTDGFGGFVNAKPGPFIIQGRRVSDQRDLGEVSILVKAGELAVTRFVPVPAGPSTR